MAKYRKDLGMLLKFGFIIDHYQNWRFDFIFGLGYRVVFENEIIYDYIYYDYFHTPYPLEFPVKNKSIYGTAICQFGVLIGLGFL